MRILNRAKQRSNYPGIIKKYVCDPLISTTLVNESHLNHCFFTNQAR